MVMVMMVVMTVALVVIIVVMMLMLLAEFFKLCMKSVFTHSGNNLCAAQFRPWCSNQTSAGVQFFQKSRGFHNLFFACAVSPAHDNEIRMDNLI